MADYNNQNQQPPPYPYQQPLQGHHSGDYAPYPNFNAQQQAQQQGQQQQGYGTPVMGAPANPSAHPDNQHAATGGYDGQQASRTQAAPSVAGQATQDPYVQPSATSAPNTPTTPGKGGSMEQMRAQLNEYGKKAELVINNLWGHLSTGPSVADNAWGRVSAGTQLLTKGGFEGVFKSTFPVDADEKLKKTYACFLSTSTGPVGGTLYISNKKLAFCSDRPLSYTPEGGQQQAPATGQQTPANAQQSFSYYKVIIPINKIRDVNPSVNQQKVAEKYIQVTTQDDFEFWFMGFVNYDKGVKNLQEAAGVGGHPVNVGGQSTGGAHQQPYPPNQPTNQDTYPPNQYGTPPS